MKVFYYYCYLFYTKVIPDNEPFAMTVFALSFTESFLLFSLCNIVFAYLYCIELSKWIGISMMIVISVLNYFIFNKSGLARKIVDDKPTFFDSDQASKVIFGLFFFLGVSSLFWGPIWMKHILDRCA